MNVYYIIIVLALALTGYFVFLQVMMKKRKEKQLNEFGSAHSNIPLTEDQKRILSYGAVLFYYRQEKILGIKPENRLDEYVGGLKHQWDITDSQEAHSVLNGLLELKRSEEFHSLIQQSSELSKIQEQIAKGLGIEVNDVKQTKSAYAWDTCRAIALAKWCYWVGYLSEDEMWEVMGKASDIAREKGESWIDYMVSFLLGRTIQGFDLDDIIVESKQILSGKNPLIGKVEDIDVLIRYSFK